MVVYRDRNGAKLDAVNLFGNVLYYCVIDCFFLVHVKIAFNSGNAILVPCRIICNSSRSNVVRQHRFFKHLPFHKRLQRKGFERLVHFPGYLGPDVPHKALLGTLTKQGLF